MTSRTHPAPSAHESWRPSLGDRSAADCGLAAHLARRVRGTRYGSVDAPPPPGGGFRDYPPSPINATDGGRLVNDHSLDDSWELELGTKRTTLRTSGETESGSAEVQPDE